MPLKGISLSIAGLLTTTLALSQPARLTAGFVFPEKIGEFLRVDVHKFDREGKDMSVGYNYRSSPIAATIYVYPRGQLRYPVDIKAELNADIKAIKSSHQHASLIPSEAPRFHLGGQTSLGFFISVREVKPISFGWP